MLELQRDFSAQTTNLRVGRSNRSGRAIKINGLSADRRSRYMRSATVPFTAASRGKTALPNLGGSNQHPLGIDRSACQFNASP
jgi:hypothetical protein